MMKRACTKCGIKYDATLEFYRKTKTGKDGLRRDCRNCERKQSKAYYQNNKPYAKKWQKDNVDKCRLATRKYDTSFHGRVSRLMKEANRRCSNPSYEGFRYYGGRGIKICFTRGELHCWLVKNGIDPRGLQIHRIDNEKNYTLYNIEFLTPRNHTLRHMKEDQDAGKVCRDRYGRFCSP